MEATSVAVILIFGYFGTVYSSNAPVKTLVSSWYGYFEQLKFSSSWLSFVPSFLSL